MNYRISQRLFSLLPQARSFKTGIDLQAQSFQSSISLSKIYPDSSLNIAKEAKIPSNEEQFNGYIPLEKLSMSYMSSSGPGGQNVNKVNTKVDLRFKLDEATWLPLSLKENIKSNHSHLLTPSGYMITRSDKTRSQHLNMADTLDKLRNKLHSATARAPKPMDHFTMELNRRRHEKSVRERLREKKHRSDVKSSRGSQ